MVVYQLRYLFLAMLIGGSALTFGATAAGAGIDELEHPEGISIRQTSTDSSGNVAFFAYYSTRSHMGGGLSGGK